MRSVAWLAAGGFVLCAFPHGPAKAGLFTKKITQQQLNFTRCDGYQAPSRADGLTTATWLYGLASTTADQRRSETELGAAGVAACNAALADPLLKPAFTMRRAHLLQSKAMHLIAQGNFRDAIASLNESDAAGRAEPLFNGSLGQGNRALRATALFGLGKSNEAEAALSELERLRPYAVSLQILAASVRMQFEDDRAKQIAILEREAAVLPDARHRLFWLAMMYDDYASALRLAPGVRFDVPRDRIGWTTENGDIEKYRLIKDKAEFAGALAFAQLASGQGEAAAATIRGIRDAIADWVRPPPPPPQGQSLRKSEVRDFEARKTSGAAARAALAPWESALALHVEAKGKSIAEIDRLVSDRKPTVFAISSLVASAAAPQPTDTANIQAVLKELEASKDAARLKQDKIGFKDLVKLLPRPETPAMQPKMQTEGAGIMRSDLNGYGVRNNEEPGSFTVRFGTATGSMAMADEAALLAAANHAVKLGNDSFFVDTRQSIQRTTQIVGMYGGGPTVPSGYEVRLCVRPMNAAAVPADQRGKLVNAAAVINALSNKFPAAR